MKPLVFVFDMDGTFIGDIHWLSVEYFAIKHHNRISPPGSRVKYQTNLLYKDLQKGMIRPYFRSFVKKIQKQMYNVECFVYTASEHSWAEFIIPKLEKVMGIKFHRPLFTRKHCLKLPGGGYVKSLDKIRPMVYKTLAKKYGLRHPSEVEHMILFDNQPHNLLEGKHQQIVCPTYDFKYPVHMLRQFDIHALVPKTLLSYLELPHSLGSSTESFFSKYYSWLGHLFKRAEVANQEYTKDTYWRDMWRKCKHIHLNTWSTDKIIQYLSLPSS